MKKTFLIIGISALVIVLLGVAWWYLLMNGAPEGLSGLNPFSGSGEEFAAPTPSEDGAEDTPTSLSALRKISAEPVAGAVALSRDGKTHIRFIMRGTGHVFEYDPESGSTLRLSGATIPRVTRAIWSPQGTRIVLFAETGEGSARVFATALTRSDTGEGTLTTSELPSASRNVAFASSTESVYYTLPSESGATGWKHNLQTGERGVVFQTPLRDIVVLWEPELIVYTAPSAALPGYAYSGADFSRIAGAPGLMVTPAGAHRILSRAAQASLVSFIDAFDGPALAVPVFPEKCAFAPERADTLWCTAPLLLPPGAYPDLWYQGAVSFDDALWQLDAATGSATLLIVPSESVGEAVDATDMQASPDGSALIFINKKDGALWLYEVG